MALLSLEGRKKRFKYLDLGEYNKANILKFQKMAFSDKKQHDGIYGTQTDNALRTFYNCKRVTKDFKASEFRCTCGRCSGYPSYMKQVELKHLQSIRDHFGRPMIITSGLRCAYENSRAGGVPNSGHLRGYAADIVIRGVTEHVDQRVAALKWIVTLPNHQFTYGAYMVDSEGNYRTAAGMGNAMHTETHKPKKTESVSDKILAACKVQAEWMKNYIYAWKGKAKQTIADSKYYGTCVTYVACVLQRLGLLKPDECIWHNGKGKVSGTTDKMTVKYPKGKTLKALRDELKAGDIIIAGDPKSTEAGGNSHIFILSGKWDKNGNPYIWDNRSCDRVRAGKNGLHTYSGAKNVIAVVRVNTL